MRFDLSSWSIRRPVAPLLLFALLTLLGIQSFTTLPITRFPTIDIPLVSVSIAQPGAAPSEMEAQVTKEIEDAVAGLTGVKNVTSTITDGVSTTVVEFRMEVPTDKAVQDTKDAIDRIRGELPGTAEDPIVSRVDVEGQAIMTFAAASPGMATEDLSWFIDDVAIRALQGLPGVGRVDRYGGADREIRIDLDPIKLDSYGITAQAVNAQLRATNANIGAGRMDGGLGEQALRALGDAQTVESLARTTIALPSGRFVRLSDLGTITDGAQEPRSFVRLNGELVVTFAVFRAKGASEVDVAEAVQAEVDKLAAAHPEIEMRMVDDTVFYTLGNYEAALATLVEGAILAVLVVWAFLRNVRATLIAAVALPLSAIPTFYVMDLLGFSLNLISFLAITLATGILVDDAIVEVENIARHTRMGKTPYRAAIDAADEIGLAVIATSFTIVAVFVPVSFMPGVPGQYFRQFGLTVAIAVLFSLLVARMIAPLMAAYLMRAKDSVGHGEGREGRVMRAYLWLARAATDGHIWKVPARYVTLMVSVLVLVGSVAAMLRIPGSFIPPEDVSRIPLSIELPPGSDLARTQATTERIRQAVLGLEGIEDVLILGGASPTGDRDVRLASVTVLLDPLDHSLLLKASDLVNKVPLLGALIPDVPTEGRRVAQAAIEAQIFDRLSGVPDVRVFKLNDRGERDISLSILARSGEDLDSAAAILEQALGREDVVANVGVEGALPRPEIRIVPRADEAARLGITTAQIAEAVRVATIGDVDAGLAKLSIDDRLIPVRVRLSEDARGDRARLAALRLPTATGATVPLSVVADIVPAQGPAAIERLNRERRATIGANLPPGVALGTATARVAEVVAATPLPEGVRIQEAGDAEVQREVGQAFVDAMILGLFLVLAVLILLFGSVTQPLTILLSLPLAIGGVAGALWLTSAPVSMPVLIGVLMLMGIVTKNAILLVDAAIELRAQGRERVEAVLEAGRKRAQPIVMTSIAMAAGMLPSALGVGEGGSFRAPMATAVIGGIIASTALSLVVVPAFYLIMDDVGRGLRRLFGRAIGPSEPDPVVLGDEAIDARLRALEARVP